MTTNICCAVLSTMALLTVPIATSSRGKTFTIARLNDSRPIITQAMFDAVGATSKESSNIQGPSVIRVPDWIAPDKRPSPDARYYMYFAHHHGDYIRMAWASDIEGTWNLFQIGADVEVGHRGVLDLGRKDRLEIGSDILIRKHIASPDIHVDDDNQLIVMYFHGPTGFKGEDVGQKSFVATSDSGLDFSSGIKPVILGRSYFRVFQHNGELYAISNGGGFHRALDPENPWVPPAEFGLGSDLWTSGVNPFADDLKAAGHSGRVRHSAVRLVGDTLQVLYTRIADSPERILLSTIDLSVGDFTLWESTFPPEEILKPEMGWEGADLKLTPSKSGYAPKRVNQLRDPCIFQGTDGSIYLFYSGGGEDAIGMARLIPRTAK